MRRWTKIKLPLFDVSLMVLSCSCRFPLCKICHTRVFTQFLKFGIDIITNASYTNSYGTMIERNRIMNDCMMRARIRNVLEHMLNLKWHRQGTTRNEWLETSTSQVSQKAICGIYRTGIKKAYLKQTALQYSRKILKVNNCNGI